MSRPRLIGLLLVLGTLLVYLPATRNQFVIYDDGEYVAQNPQVQKGLTWAGVRWAFTTGKMGNWHPVTWLSHMTDCELFGLNAGAHHAVNVLFHMADAGLLLLLLFRLTGALWPSAFVAALFAWHPLHVESVAWVAERKDVLSTFFGLLTLLAYARFAAESKIQSSKSKAFYTLALIFFALGLMSKPMLVTLPCVMLLLDFWPLQRVSNFEFRPALCARLALEKWPFFLLVAASSVATLFTQRHDAAMMTLQQFPLPLRIENALVSYLRYLAKTVWPSPLAVLYPLVIHLAWMRVTAVASAILLVLTSWLLWRRRRSCPYLLVGWLWYLGTLVPVIGLVQVGSAAMADRYTYFPLIGVFLAVAFGARDLVNRFPNLKAAVVAAAVLALAACVTLTENQLRYWRDSEALFAHTLAVTGENPNALIDYGIALEQKGETAAALARYREAARLSPGSVQAHHNIANLLDNLGQPAAALPEQRLAVQLDPQSAMQHNGLGILLTELGRYDEALAQFQEASRLDPAYPWAHFEAGKMYLKQGRDADAIEELRQALRLAPDSFQILAFTAHVLAAEENPEVRDGRTALVLAAKANALTGGNQPYVLDALGMACAATGDFTNALAVAQRALDLATAANMKNLGPLQERLRCYQNHQPWQESFQATNAPAKP